MKKITKAIGKICTADLRRSILTTLLLSEDYQLNQLLIGEILDYQAKVTTTDHLRRQLLWLEEQGLVSIEETDGFEVFIPTERGLEVATGRTAVRGVRELRPSEVRSLNACSNKTGKRRGKCLITVTLIDD